MSAPVCAAPRFSREQFAELKRRTIFECGKWDPQYEDSVVLADFALLIEPETWRELAALAEQLAREALAAESELIARTDLHARLGLPRALRRSLREARTLGPTLGAARVLRFDFHWTSDGWRISEVNSDVPGGFIEASGFSGLAGQALELSLAGNPTRAFVDAITRAIEPRATIALVHATAYSDDRQVMLHVARALEARGLRTCLLDPTQVRWRDGRAHAAVSWCPGPIDLIVRFYPAEWLPRTPADCGWRNYFRGSRTPISNPGAALLIQSKRFPLTWDALATDLTLWRALLPETRSPRDVNWRDDESWILKPAFGRVGEDIGLRAVIDARDWRGIARAARWWPAHWVAQRRFEAVVCDCNGELVYPCLGVYVIDDRASGIYGRVAHRPLIDARARDVAVFVSA